MPTVRDAAAPIRLVGVNDASGLIDADNSRTTSNREEARSDASTQQESHPHDRRRRPIDGIDVSESPDPQQTGHTTLDYGFVNTAATRSPRSPSSTATRASCATAATRSSSSRRTAPTSRWPGCSSTASCRPPTSSPVRRADPPPHAAARRPQALLLALPHTAHPMSVLSSARSRRCRPTTRTRPTSNNPEHVELTTIRMLAKLPGDRRIRAQEEHRAGVPLPRQLAELRRQLPQAQLRHPGRAVRGQPGHVPRARAAADPARGPRAERLDLDGAARRLHRRQPCSRRSPPASTPSTARCTAARTRPCSRCSARIRDSGESVQRFVERVKNKEDGVKLMGFGHRVYKNYDPRAQARQGERRRGARRPRRAGPAARPRQGARGSSRSPTTTSTSAGSTRTSTSTPA